MAEVSPQFTRGEGTLTIPMSLHAKNRCRLFECLRPDIRVPEGAVVLLKGGSQQTRYDTDHEPFFRQESYFHWTFGVAESGFLGALSVDTGRAILFCPKHPEECVAWHGTHKSKDYFQERYAVDEVYYTDEIANWFATQKPTMILTLRGRNTDSGKYSEEATFPGIEKYCVNNSILHFHMMECRVIKTPEELEVLRYVGSVSSKAHIEIMKKVRPGMKEYQIESMFQHYCSYHGGCRHTSFTSVCATGRNSAILHYGHAGEPNAKVIKDGDMCTFDMGGEYYCYASDITCSYPVNGKFTTDQEIIYNSVLKARRAILRSLRPGYFCLTLGWKLSNTVCMFKSEAVVGPHQFEGQYMGHFQLITEEALLTELESHGLLQGLVSEMVRLGVGALFFPHGVGHFMGIDVHDVGGYPPGEYRSTRPGYRSLRAGRILKQGMVVTIAPGCYFIEELIAAAMADDIKAKFLCPEVILRFMKVGGVRIEDDLVITARGAKLLNKVPRTVAQIEKIMAEGRREEMGFTSENICEHQEI